MIGNKFQSYRVAPTTSKVSSRSSTKEANSNKRLVRRIQWLGDDECKPQKFDDDGVKKQTSTRPTIRRSMASTDLTRAACREVRDPTNRNSEIDTGSAEVELSAKVQQCGERFGLLATPGCAGTFRMSIVSDASFGPEVKCLIEFKVWKTMDSPELKRLWFTVRHAMSPAAATAIRALEVWTDRKNGYPAKVVFSQK